jgi:hypothetical protein
VRLNEVGGDLPRPREDVGGPGEVVRVAKPGVGGQDRDLLHQGLDGRRCGRRPARYRRVAANPDALLVKQADLDDNTDPSRLAALDAATRSRLEAKYAKARAALGLA